MQSAVLMVQCSKSKKQWYIHPSILHLRLYPSSLSASTHSIPSHHITPLTTPKASRCTSRLSPPASTLNTSPVTPSNSSLCGASKL